MICCSARCTNAPQSAPLQVLKALLTAATVCEAHGWGMRMVLATVFAVSIHASAPVNLATARTTLTQIINFTYHKMESASRVGRQRGGAAAESAAPRPLAEAAALAALHSAAGPPSNKDGQLTPWHTDAAVIFTYLCEVAQTTEVSGRMPLDHASMRHLISSLELEHKLL
eukprot:gene6034-7840_t